MKIMAGIVTTIQQGCCCCSPINPHLLEACGLETAEINNLPPLLGDSLEDLGYCSHLSWQILQCHTNWEWCRRVSNLTQTGAMSMDIIIIINTKGWIHQELMIIIRKARDTFNHASFCVMPALSSSAKLAISTICKTSKEKFAMFQGVKRSCLKLWLEKFNPIPFILSASVRCKWKVTQGEVKLQL